MSFGACRGGIFKFRVYGRFLGSKFLFQRPLSFAPVVCQQAVVEERRQKTEKSVQSQQVIKNTFFDERDTNFEQLGLSKAVCEAMQQMQITRPSSIQTKAIPAILNDNDVIIAAETGSGKTLAYLAPIISVILCRDKVGQDSEASNGSNSAYSAALILCPNRTLCEQVFQVVQLFKNSEGESLLSCQIISGSSPPRSSSEFPDIVISTPGGILNLLFEDSWYGRMWSKDHFMSNIKWIVVDEVDMMLDGSYKEGTQRLLELGRKEERKRTYWQVVQRLGITPPDFMALQNKIRIAAYYGGVPAMVKAGYQPPKDIQISNEELESAPDKMYWEKWFQEFPFASTKMRSRRYIFAGATIPEGGQISMSGLLKNYFRDAAWIRGNSLHANPQNIQHTWIQSDDFNLVSDLRQIVLHDELLQQGQGRVLVFVSQVNQVGDAVSALENDSIPIVEFHKKLSPEQTSQNLSRFRGEQGIVMVATDSAARGIDIPNVTHVVQAAFAESAVAFLHRIGRTGRAGQQGRVTSLYLQKDEELVEAIRSFLDKGESIEGAFSRRRSFRKKIKKYGEFVPRIQNQEKPLREISFNPKYKK